MYKPLDWYSSASLIAVRSKFLHQNMIIMGPHLRHLVLFQINIPENIRWISSGIFSDLQKLDSLLHFHRKYGRWHDFCTIILLSLYAQLFSNFQFKYSLAFLLSLVLFETFINMEIKLSHTFSQYELYKDCDVRRRVFSMKNQKKYSSFRVMPMNGY